jgi:hypothetical protein
VRFGVKVDKDFQMRENYNNHKLRIIKLAAVFLYHSHKIKLLTKMIRNM